MTTRREFIKQSAAAVSGAALMGLPLSCGKAEAKSKVVSAAAEDMLADELYNPDAVHRAFDAAMCELTGQGDLKHSWASLFSPEDIVGIKVNCIGAPKVSSSLVSINETIAGLQSAGVKPNHIVIWDRMDRELPRTGLKLNKSGEGVQVRGTSTEWEGAVPWVEGYDRDVFISLEDGTLKQFRELMKSGLTETGEHRDIFNACTWLWMLAVQDHPRAKGYQGTMRKLYMDYSDTEGIRRLAEEVADKFDDVEIEDEEKSTFSNIVTKDITKLVNIAVLKHNEDSGVTLATKNIALGVTTNKIRFHVDYCTKSIPMILSKPCIRDKMVLHIGEAARISTVSVAGARMAYDKRILFSRDPVAMDRIGLDILEEKRAEQGLSSIRDISTHIAGCARAGLGTNDPKRIDLREINV